MSRKDSKGIFANILGDNSLSAPQSPASSSSPHLRKVAAGIRQLQEREEMVDRLIRDDARVVEIDCRDIAMSVIQDRFDGAYEDAAIAELAASMRESGQVVPGLVRPIADSEQKFQIVFGRRRLAAARLIGIAFKAVIKTLSDEEAIILQGEENSNREDLSFLERCLFAQAQEAAGFKRDTIGRSLATSKSHLSEMLRLVSTVPRETLLLIGRSPEIGRRRWLDFAEAWTQRVDARDAVETALSSARSSVAPEQRFSVALAALRKNENKNGSSGDKQVEIHADGKLLAVVGQSKAGAKLNFNKSVDPQFVQHLAELLPTLHAEFVNNRKG